MATKIQRCSFAPRHLGAVRQWRRTTTLRWEEPHRAESSFAPVRSSLSHKQRPRHIRTFAYTLKPLLARAHRAPKAPRTAASPPTLFSQLRRRHSRTLLAKRVRMLVFSVKSKSANENSRYLREGTGASNRE